jgi:acetyl esterase/lipase
MKITFKIIGICIMLLLFLSSSIQASVSPNNTDITKKKFSFIKTLFSNDAKPPEQPESGPGGSNYSHYGVKKTRHGFGGQRYWIFEPYGPKPDSAPVIVFNHGFTAINPIIYREWIYHLVKRGNIVIYPRYQQYIFRGSEHYATNAVNAVKQAIQHLQNTGSIQLELEHFAITGHSLGAGITMYMAAVAQQQELPIPKAIMPVQPFLRTEYNINLSKISEETLMLVVVGENDTVVGNHSAKYIFYNTSQIPLSQKDYIEGFE